MNIFLVVVFRVLFQLDLWFWSEGLQNVGPVVEDPIWFHATKVFPSWFQEFFINWHHGSSRQFRIPERFWLVQSVLKSVIINSFYPNGWEVFGFPVYIVIQTFDWVLNQVKCIRFFICYIFQRCHEIFCSDVSVFISFWIIPLRVFSKLVGISQTVFWNRPVLSKSRH